MLGTSSSAHALEHDHAQLPLVTLHFLPVAALRLRPTCSRTTRAEHARAGEVFVRKPRTTFVLIADASRARLYSRNLDTGKLVLLEEIEHPLGRAKATDLMADKPGRTFSSGGQSNARSAKEYSTDPEDVEAEKFARDLARRLASSFDAHIFEDLVVAAPPKFLGLMRATLATHHNHISDRVIAWHDKDYTPITNLRELGERLFGGEPTV